MKLSNRTNTAKWVEARQRWQINVQKDGKRKTFTSSTVGRTGQREANKKADIWLDSNIVSSNVKIKHLYKKFSDEQKDFVSKSAMVNIEKYGRLWIIEHLGDIKITSLNDSHTQKMLDTMAAKDLSKKTIQNARSVLNKFLKWCRQNKYTDYRLDDVAVPSGTRLKGKTILQPQDIAILLSSDKTTQKNKEVFEPLVYAFRFSVFTGVRPGELRALKREDIQGDTVYIKSAVNVYKEVTKGKNDNAVRSFIMSQQAKEALTAQLELNPDGETIFDLPPHSTLYHRWQAYINHNGITPVSLYELRHTFVSVVKALAPGEIKPIIGHSKDMDTFGVYSHSLTGEDRAVADKITEQFNLVKDLKSDTN